MVALSGSFRAKLKLEMLLLYTNKCLKGNIVKVGYLLF